MTPEHTPEPSNDGEKCDVQVNTTNTILYCSLIALTGFPLGWEVGHTGNLISNADFQNHFGASASVLGIIVSSFNFGALIGCLAIPPLSKVVGFRYSILVASAVYLLGWLIQFLVLILNASTNYLWFSSGRVLCGVCCGALTVLGPVFISHQVLNKAHLGFYLSFFQISICIFILVGNVLFYISSNPLVAMVTAVVFLLLSILSLAFVPESNLFLLQKGRHNAITRNFRSLFKIDHETQLMQKVDEFIHPVPAAEPKLPKYFDVKNCIRCCAVMVFQQLTGVNYFFYFAVIIFNKVLTVNLSNIPIIIMAVINLVGALVTSKLILKFGPINLLKTGSISMTILLVMYSILGLIIDSSPNLSLSIIVIGISWLFVFIFAISWGPCCNIIINLLSNNNSTIISVAVFTNWLANFVITISSPIIIQTIGFGYGLVFAASALALIFFTEYIQKMIK